MKQLITTALLCFLISIPAGAQLFDPSQVDLEIYEKRQPKTGAEYYFNDLGMTVYDKQNFRLAAGLFYRAAVINPRYSNAHYNLACTMALIKKETEKVQGLSELDFIIRSHLAQAINLDPKWRTHMQTDTDLSSIQGLSYFRFLSLDPKGSLSQWLTSIPTWYGPQGDSPSTPLVKFFKDGRVYFQYFINAGESNPSYGPPQWGTYTLDKDNLLIKQPAGDGVEKFRGTIQWKISEDDGQIDVLSIQLFGTVSYTNGLTLDVSP